MRFTADRTDSRLWCACDRLLTKNCIANKCVWKIIFFDSCQEEKQTCVTSFTSSLLSVNGICILYLIWTYFHGNPIGKEVSESQHFFSKKSRGNLLSRCRLSLCHSWCSMILMNLWMNIRCVTYSSVWEYQTLKLSHDAHLTQLT